MRPDGDAIGLFLLCPALLQEQNGIATPRADIEFTQQIANVYFYCLLGTFNTEAICLFDSPRASSCRTSSFSRSVSTLKDLSPRQTFHVHVSTDSDALAKDFAAFRSGTNRFQQHFRVAIFQQITVCACVYQRKDIAEASDTVRIIICAVTPSPRARH